MSDQGENAVYGSLARSLDALTIGNADATADREERDKVLRGYDMSQNLQVPVAGVAGRDPVWVKTEVFWPNPFLTRIDRSRSDSDLEDPHFTYGIELQSDANVIVVAIVRDWIENPETGWLIGARVRVCAWCPQARKKHPFNGKLHMSFSGYAAPAESEDEI